MQDFAPVTHKSDIISGAMETEVALGEMKTKPWMLFNNMRVNHRNNKYFGMIKTDLKRNGVSKRLLIDLAWLDKYMRAREMMSKTTYYGNVKIKYLEAIPELDIQKSAIIYEMAITEGIEIKIMINADIDKDSPIIVRWEITVINDNGNATTSSAEMSYRDVISMETQNQRGGSSIVRKVASTIPEMISAKLRVMIDGMQWGFVRGFLNLDY